MPDWYKRGLPSAGHAALEPLVGLWRVHFEIHGSLGRSPDEPPLVSDDIFCRREWVAGGRYIEDTTEGTVEGAALLASRLARLQQHGPPLRMGDRRRH